MEANTSAQTLRDASTRTASLQRHYATSTFCTNIPYTAYLRLQEQAGLNVDNSAMSVQANIEVNQSRPREYRPLVHLIAPVPLAPPDDNSNCGPTFMMPLAETSRPAHEAIRGTSSYNQTQDQLEYLDTHIDKMPTNVLRTADMKLMNKADVLRELRSFIRRGESGKYGDIEHADAWRLASFAILSHRWGERELSYQDMCGEPDHAALRKTQPAFRKLEEFCRVARMHGCNWAWADTCCIDKTSSAELDEAIRSMYEWYKNAAICIVHLADTVYCDDLPGDAWFTRGWTLQELLAPRRIKLFNRNWLPLTSDQNDKDLDSTLIQVLSDITTIPCHDIAFYRSQVGTGRIKEKMCWAAKRATTRVEDVAYSLIGIFDVSMAIMYGEGSRAFYRLQLAIAEQTNELEIFFWKDRASGANRMLAAAPQNFVPPASNRVMLTVDEVKQLAPRDTWRLIVEMTTSPDGRRLLNGLRGNRSKRLVRAEGDQEWQSELVRRVRTGLLERMEPETVQRIGPGLLRRVDGEVLRRIGSVLLKKHPALEPLLDDSTRKRMGRYSSLSWIPWGGQKHAMTGAGLAIDVVLYDVQITAPSRSDFTEDPFTICTPTNGTDVLWKHSWSHIGLVLQSFWTHFGSQVSSQREGPSSNHVNSDHTCSYATVSSNHLLGSTPMHDANLMQDGLKLAVLDYYLGDTLHDPEHLRSALKKSHLRATHNRELDLASVVAELETRLYRGVFLVPHARGNQCFSRVDTVGTNVTLVRRPEGGWDRPQRVYIK